MLHFCVTDSSLPKAITTQPRRPVAPLTTALSLCSFQIFERFIWRGWFPPIKLSLVGVTVVFRDQ